MATTHSMPPHSAAETPPEPPRFEKLQVERVSLGTALRHNWWLVVIVTLLCIGAGAGYGLIRDPVYTAREKLTVNRINLSAPGALSGYAQASQALAAGYSRAITADAVVLPVARAAKLSPDTVRARLSATPVPESPVFAIEAQGPSEASSVRLAHLASDSLLAYISQLGRSAPDADRLYAKFQVWAQRANQHRAEIDRIQRLLRQGQGSSALRASLVDAQTAFDSADLKTQALKQAYTVALAGQSSTEPAQVLSPAVSGVSDRRRKVELIGFGGLVAGLLLGGSLAYVLERLKMRRRRRRLARAQ